MSTDWHLASTRQTMFLRSEYQRGHMKFCDHTIAVDRRVLVPRSKTETTARVAAETVRRMAQEQVTPLHVVDVGTGAGAIIITIALHCRGLPIYYFATDLSSDALEVARTNLQLHDLESQVELIQCDLLERLPVRPDVVVANLPYMPRSSDVPPEVRCEPAIAVFDAGDGTVLIRRLFSQLNSGQMLPKVLIVETAPEHIQKLLTILEADMTQQPNAIEIHCDQDGMRRVLEVIWI